MSLSEDRDTGVRGPREDRHTEGTRGENGGKGWSNVLTNQGPSWLLKLEEAGSLLL